MSAPDGGLSALRPVSRQRLHEQVVERLLSYVIQAGLHEGDRLPAERQLATRLAVSRTSVRQAIAILASQGILEVRHGDGTLLRNLDPGSEPFARLLARRRHLPEVLEAREALEVKIAELAARRRTSADLDDIESALGRMEAEIEAGNIGAEGDRAFHRAIAIATHNRLFCQLMDSIADDIAETRIESLSQPGRPSRSLVAHRRIADAIGAGDPERAADAMREHLAVVSDVGLLHWDPEQQAAQGAG